MKKFPALVMCLLLSMAVLACVLTSIDAILNELIRREKGLEVNTAGIRRGMEQTNPTFPVIARYHELGGRLISVGSDAHHPEDLGADFDKAEAFLRKAGFTEYNVYHKRKPVFLPL